MIWFYLYCTRTMEDVVRKAASELADNAAVSTVVRVAINVYGEDVNGRREAEAVHDASAVELTPGVDLIAEAPKGDPFRLIPWAAQKLVAALA